MGYEVPALKDLKRLAAILVNSYQGTKKSRLDFIKVVNRLVDDEELMKDERASKILMGAYLFEMEHIYKSYDHLAYAFLSAERSTLYKALADGLGITKEECPGDSNKLIYIAAFYNYVKNDASQDLANDTQWCSTQSLLDAVKVALRRVLTRQYPQLECLVQSLPTYEHLYENVTDVRATYDKLSPKQVGWVVTTGNEHAHLAEFIDFINRYCDYLQELEQKYEGEDRYKGSTQYKLLMGSVAYAMKEIENEYKYLSPKRTTMHKLCTKASNIKFTDNTDPGERKGWLLALATHLYEMKDKHREFLQKSGFQQDISGLIDKISKQIPGCTPRIITTNSVQSQLTSATSGAAQYGLRNGIRRVTGVALNSPVKYMIDGAAAVGGFVMFGPGGAVVATSLTSILRNFVFPGVVAAILSSVLERTGRVIAGTATSAVVVPVTVASNGVIRIYCKYKGYQEFDPAELVGNDEYIKAVLSLTDDLITPDKREVINRMVGPMGKFKDASLNSNHESPEQPRLGGSLSM